ncbi:GDP-mannose 4,6-dehydratase [Candidatus Saccharibacteria bacterium]|nr:GDP-mannose 4,6-dehydratase [Candidatus Saccharibacteria bacterium]MBR0415680.1 GDP-mannose 4,6-dehydratase [Candidatus Saccharibacteria bacterium]
MKTYLITGGAGFIGSTIAQKLLENGERVVVVDNFNDFYDPQLKKENIKPFLENPNFEIYEVDIRNVDGLSKVFDENKIDIVIHLAAMAGVRPSIENPMLYQDVNGMGTQNVLEQAKLHNIKKLVMASSSSVYGNCKEVSFREDMIVDFAISPYAATKKANEVMAHVYHKLFGMSIIMLRFFTVYGPKQRPDLAINKFTRMMMNGEEITMYGDGTTSRDYTYVDDIVDGVVKSCNYVDKNENVYEIINLGSNNPISLKDMIATIGKVLGVNPKIKQMPMQPGDVDRTYADVTKAKELLGYEPKMTFEEGIRKFVEWKKCSKAK